VDIHKEHDDGEPIQKYKDKTYSFGLENTYSLLPLFLSTIVQSINHLHHLVTKIQNMRKVKIMMKTKIV